MKLYKIGEFADIIGVTSQTLRKWDKNDKLKPQYISPTGWRYYTEEQEMEYKENNKNKSKKNKVNIAYARSILGLSIEKQIELINMEARKRRIKIDEIIIEKNDLYEMSSFKDVVEDMLEDKIKMIIVADRKVIMDELLMVFYQISNSKNVNVLISIHKR